MPAAGWNGNKSIPGSRLPRPNQDRRDQFVGSPGAHQGGATGRRRVSESWTDISRRNSQNKMAQTVGAPIAGVGSLSISGVIGSRRPGEQAKGLSIWARANRSGCEAFTFF
jgi:hypothetical protein